MTPAHGWRRLSPGRGAGVGAVAVACARRRQRGGAPAERPRAGAAHQPALAVRRAVRARAPADRRRSTRHRGSAIDSCRSRSPIAASLHGHSLLLMAHPRAQPAECWSSSTPGCGAAGRSCCSPIRGSTGTSERAARRPRCGRRPISPTPDCWPIGGFGSTADRRAGRGGGGCAVLPLARQLRAVTCAIERRLGRAVPGRARQRDDDRRCRLPQWRGGRDRRPTAATRPADGANWQPSRVPLSRDRRILCTYLSTGLFRQEQAWNEQLISLKKVTQIRHWA